jgi:DNA-binding MarR family transcriptional regulator
MLTRLASCGPARAGELAGTLGIERSTLSPQIQRLERAGLVARMPDPTDGRAALLQVTRKARALLRRLERSRGDILTEILSDWPAPDIARASKVMGRVSEQLARASARAGSVNPDVV